MTLQVRVHKLKDAVFPRWREMQEWEYDDWRADPIAREGWISFDCLASDGARNAVYCGVSSFSGDIFYRFDRATGRFDRIETRGGPGDAFNAKFHRSLEWGPDGTLWAATALFHDVDRYWTAPGGELLEFQPATGAVRHVAVPLPHVYIQALAMDRVRRLLYATTFPPEYLLRYDLDSGTVRTLTLLGPGYDLVQPEQLCVDAEGCAWCTWRVTRAFSYDRSGKTPIRLLRYDPDADRVTWYRHGIAPICDHDNGKIEGMIGGRDGFVYLGSAAGALYRLEPGTAAVTFLAKPAAGPRITSFAYGPDGLIYFAAGRRPPHLFRFDTATDRIDDLGAILDPASGTVCHQVHHLVVTDDGTVFCGENDVPERSSYLWECRAG